MTYLPKAKFYRNLRRKRAISYILSVVMMTLVISALATSVLLWGISQISDARTTLSASVKARMERIQENLVVEDVKIVNSTSLRIYVRNNGARLIVIDQVYINHTAATNIAAQGGGSRLTLSVREVGFVDARFGAANFVSGSNALVRVTTSRGVANVETWKL